MNHKTNKNTKKIPRPGLMGAHCPIIDRRTGSQSRFPLQKVGPQNGGLSVKKMKHICNSNILKVFSASNGGASIPPGICRFLS